MEILIHRVDPSLPLPKYATSGAAGFDIAARTDMTIAPHAIALIPTNLIITTPNEYMLLLAARSSLPMKKGLMLANGIGIVDGDFCGPDDEIHVQVYNIADVPVTVARGERIAQGVFVKIDRASWRESSPTAKNRGGFGSTHGYLD